MKKPTTKQKRSFVVEVEKIQIVRRSCKASLIYCAECKMKTDFILLKQAETLFEIDAEKIFRFINANFSHYTTDEHGEIFICLRSFISCINADTKKTKIKLLGGAKG